MLQVIQTLLGPEGCPWDQEQTPESLCDYLVEETFELVSAIRSGDLQEVLEEMGDVIFLLAFISCLYGDKVSLGQAMQHAARKMTRRHPHVFGETDINSREELTRTWERVKKTEKKHAGGYLLDSVPRSLPPLLLAYRLHSKAAKAGFTWDSLHELEDKLTEEWLEWKNALESKDHDKMLEEFGDYLFTLVEYGRRNQIKASSALSKTNIKFARRIHMMEDLAREKGWDISRLDMDHLEELWQEAKGF
ncbi:nucleoside triphosphate pyrophosphohydrolase [Desulfonatronospira sp.]|uniref:nucleoside triphosphate pyrophosphohydrolase n=1 Tax=Desulfonatronospira sp. TaxID=1962951 RepID=UPI0025BC40FB|nr:nucleoside triphosphate pyrophosphohydrolase [Desulfonatronospira sp.]